MIDGDDANDYADADDYDDAYADAYDDDGVQRTLVGMQWRC